MAHASNGGLQQHSIGDDYPFAVVGTIRNELTHYFVKNLVTGETDGLFYLSSEAAHAMAHDYKAAERLHLYHDCHFNLKGWTSIDTSVE